MSTSTVGASRTKDKKTGKSDQSSLQFEDVKAKLNSIKGKAVDTAGLTLYVTALTPDLAKVLIRNTNARQRKLRKIVVTRYANDLRHSRWKITGDPIRIHTDGSMIDGQHRCAAVIQTGISMPDIIIVALKDPNAFSGIDIGAGRSLRDVVKMNNDQSVETSVLAAITYEASDFKAPSYTKPEAHEIVTAFPWLEEVQALHRGGIGSSGVLAAYIRAMRVDKDEATKFFTAVINNNPMIDGAFNQNSQVLSTWLYKAAADKSESKTAEGWRRKCAARCIQAWNANRQGRSLKVSTYRADLPVPEAI